MSKCIRTALAVLFCMVALPVGAIEASPSELSCDDFEFTPEAAERFADLRGACEAIVELDGHTYGRFTAVVRRAWAGGVTLNLKATDRTFTARPGPELRVLVGNERVRPRDLVRGQEISIYLSTDQFGRPNIEEVALVQEEVTATIPVSVPVEPVRALPTTASSIPAVALAGLASLILGGLLWTRRRSVGNSR